MAEHYSSIRKYVIWLKPGRFILLNFGDLIDVIGHDAERVTNLIAGGNQEIALGW
jgi:hypothetical protein